MPEIDVCSGCENIAIVHGNKGHNRGGFGRRVMLCDDCCICYEHCPGGKYYDNPMWKVYFA